MALFKDREKVKKDISKILYRIGAIKFGSFRLTSGRLSPYYIDLRLIPSFPEVFHEISELLVNFIKKELGEKNFDRIAGIPTAGIPFASTIAYLMNKPFLYIRQARKLHGRERRIEGMLTPGDKVLLVDDLITTGSSLLKAARAIVAEGGIVKDAVVFLDREEGGRERLHEGGISLHAVFKISEIAQTLHELDAIDEERLKLIYNQIRGG
ncbi:orotate phosphoribosyltransferase [Candidatus Bathyarchaeota archaeon]|nr:orotate phosphoribosyltransferase [Candidatus Bathyarchaeota archaeon]